jgi:hypothetical protein
MESVKIALIGKGTGKFTLVDASDHEGVSKIRWTIWDGYAWNSDFGKGVQHFVVGPRPDDIPEDYVLDHKNRDKLDNRRANLQWVSISFNSWNVEPIGESDYKGVAVYREDKWAATFRGVQLARFDTERAAGRAVAKAAIKYFGVWAETCDLITRHFSDDEIRQMKEEPADERATRPVRDLPKGVCFDKVSGKYIAQYRCKRIGLYDTPEEAKIAYDKRVKDTYDKELASHLAQEIPRDSEGHAVIQLVGKDAEGRRAKVPDQLWHKLTFKQKWYYQRKYAEGTWQGVPGSTMHGVIWNMLYPDYVKRPGFSIDHVITENKLDNRAENLREADKHDQARNRRKRGSGRYVGVNQDKSGKWVGALGVSVEGKQKRFCTPRCDTENEAAVLLNELRLKHWGPNAQLLVIVD